MKLLLLTLIAIFLSGCNEDAGSKRNRVESTTPTLFGDSFVTPSYMIRTRGNAVKTSAQEISDTLDNNLRSTVYRPVPEQDDDEIRKGTALNSRPLVECGGSAFSGIDARITDCRTKNPESSLWNATNMGIAGEGNWQLVALVNGKDYWLDTRTGLVWSPVVDKVNWCAASGNFEPASAASTVDCLKSGANKSFCEGADFEGIGKNVLWRLPTRNDFLQADLDGLRFVLNHNANDDAFWTATSVSNVSGNTKAWTYTQNQGTLVPLDKTTVAQVRCIGAAVR